MAKGRKSLHTKALEKFYKNKKVLITGGTGSIGSEIVRQLIRLRPSQIRIYSRDETKHFFLERELEEIKGDVDIRFLIGDIRDKERLDRAFGGVDYVFHAAALKHVPYCEYNPFEAVKTNVYGTQNLIDLAHLHNIKKIVGISTDKAVYPNTMMGITKLLMERIMISARRYAGESSTRFSIIRFGNVLSSRGSVIPLWHTQIEKGGPVTVTDKSMKRFFIAIPEAVKLILTSMAVMVGEEVFTIDMPELNIYKLAEKTIKEFGKGKKINIKITGARDREKIIERLYTYEEKELMIRRGPYRIIFPTKNIFKRRYKKYSEKWLANLSMTS